MPQIIPIKKLKNTGEISERCHSSEEPIYITKNGYGDMVIMSIETYEKTITMQDISLKLEAAERSIAAGRTKDANKSLEKMREKYGI